MTRWTARSGICECVKLPSVNIHLNSNGHEAVLPAGLGDDTVLEESYADICSVCVGAIGSTSIVEIAGEVDIATVSMLVKALGDAVHLGKGDLILDAQKLMYIDSAGLQTLLSTQRQLSTKNRRMAIVGCHGIFHKLMKTSRLDEHFHMYSTVDEALMSMNDWDVPTA